MRTLVWKPTAAVVMAALCLSVPTRLAAQDERVIRGVVRNASDSTPIGDVLIRLIHQRDMARVMSSPTGGFSLTVPAGPVRLLALRIGFAPETLSVNSQQRSLDIQLSEAPLALDPIVVSAEPAYAAASSRTVRELDLQLRPRATAQELLRLAPGLVIAQHAGGGKAEQIFLRGFDADHGTDVAVTVDGVPVNMVSHGHGQGYADLHFLMPEVVDLLEVRKGPYDAQDGDLATAGAVSFRTRDRLRAPSVEVRGGSFKTAHAVALVPFGGSSSQTGGYLAGSGHFTDGPVIAPQNYERFNLFSKVTGPLNSTVEWMASASGFSSSWDASGQVPERAVRSGLINRFGSIDPTEGGNTSRYDLSVGLRSSGEAERSWSVRAFGTKYDFDLFSNFTFFLADSVDGDGINQTDDRLMLGLDANYIGPSRLVGIAGRSSLGVGGRADFTEITLAHAVQRRVLEKRVDAGVRQQHGFVWARQDLFPSRRFRLQLGLRADLFRFGVSERATVTPARPSAVSRARTDAILSPKANLALELSPSTTLFANAGAGFHSNDARAAVRAPAGIRTLARALGGELGARHTWRGGSIAAALWGLDTESELVYVGDEGTTEASGPTRRIGIDLEGRIRVLPWLWADADITLSRGRFRDQSPDADRIPLAPTFTAVAGLTVRDAGPLSGGFRLRHVGSRAANETNTVRALGSTVAELFTTWRLGPLELVVSVDNVFNVDWNEAQFATTSRLGHEAGPVTDLHFTPGSGRFIQVGAGYRF